MSASIAARSSRHPLPELDMSGTSTLWRDLSQELFKAVYNIAFYAEDYEAKQNGDFAWRLADQNLVLPKEKEDAVPLHFCLMGRWLLTTASSVPV